MLRQKTTLEQTNRQKIKRKDKRLAQKLSLKGYKYIARDSDGELFLFFYKPAKQENRWWTEAGRAFYKNKKDFKFIKWEDKEPTFITNIINGGVK